MPHDNSQPEGHGPVLIAALLAEVGGIALRFLFKPKVMPVECSRAFPSWIARGGRPQALPNLTASLSCFRSGPSKKKLIAVLCHLGFRPRGETYNEPNCALRTVGPDRSLPDAFGPGRSPDLTALMRNHRTLRCVTLMPRFEAPR
jgi:hypothetical protein